MREFNPKFESGWVEDIRVFRSASAVPVWPLNFRRSKPRLRVGDSRLYLATSAQSYPEENSWDSMINVANNIAERVQFDLEGIYRLHSLYHTLPARAPESCTAVERLRTLESIRG
jgi:hypothetical protein